MAERTTRDKLRRARTLEDFDAIDQRDLPPQFRAIAKAWRRRLERGRADDPARARRDRLEAEARERDKGSPLPAGRGSGSIGGS